MTEQGVEVLSQFKRLVFQQEQRIRGGYDACGIDAKIQITCQNLDNKESLKQSGFRLSDSMIDRRKIISFEKTGDLIKRMKRELSSQEFQKATKKEESWFNDKSSTQHSHCNLRTLQCQARNQGHDEITEAIIDQYEKQILRLKAELEDVNQEKNQIRQTLQKERRFYMTEMYNKQLILEQSEFEIDKLRDQIEKHIHLQQKFQEKIRLLQIQNAEFKYQLQAWINESGQYSDGMEPIDEENQDFCNNSTGVSRINRRDSNNKMCMSFNKGFSQCSMMVDEDSFETLRIAHEKEIQRYEKQIKSLKEFYENKLKAIRRSMTPAKYKQRSSINIVDDYVCPDTYSFSSQSRPHNLRSILKEHFNNERSNKKMDDTISFATSKCLVYPENCKQNLYGENLFIRQTQCSELEIKCVDLACGEQSPNNSQNGFKKYLESYLPCKKIIKGFAVGSLASALLGYVIYKSLIRK